VIKTQKQSFNFFSSEKTQLFEDFESLINLLLIGLKSLPIIEKFKLFSIIEFRNIRIFNDLIINSIIQKCKCFGRVTNSISKRLCQGMTLLFTLDCSLGSSLVSARVILRRLATLIGS
jgi:hypothetical protein